MKTFLKSSSEPSASSQNDYSFCYKWTSQRLKTLETLQNRDEEKVFTVAFGRHVTVFVIPWRQMNILTSNPYIFTHNDS